MKRLVSIAAALIAAAVGLVIAVTPGGSSQTAQASNQRPAASAVSIKSTPLGRILVDAHGRTLYLFAADKPNVSTLSRAGLAVWPALRATVKPQAGGGASVAMIATIPATSQVTYGGHPLYHFVGDHGPGKTNGQGLNKFGARWYVVGSGGSAITTSATAQSQPSGASNGY